MLKRVLWFFLFPLCLLTGGIWLYEKMTDGFYESAIHLHTWPQIQYDSVRSQYTPQKVRTILNQPFIYLGKGRQFFVFASGDGKYVLKFIKCQRIDLPDWYKAIPLPGFLQNTRQKKLSSKQARIESMFASLVLASGKLSENTGVVFAHLNIQSQIKSNVTLIDKLGVSHSIAIDEVPFILQKRAVGVIPTFNKLFEMHDFKGVEEMFNQLIDLIVLDAQEGVVDKDSGTIERDNVGFLQDKAIHIDIGTFESRQDTLSRKNLEEQFSRLEPLLDMIAAKNPNLSAQLKEKINTTINTYAN